MAKGVKKIKYIKGNVYPDMSVPNVRLTIKPNQWVWFMVSEWESGTTEKDKERELTWLLQNADRNIILSEKKTVSTGSYGIVIPKKLCGSYHFYVEASLFGSRDFRRQAGLYVRGYCPAKIVSSKWCKFYNGDDERKTYQFSYGENIYLHLATEGLNGDKVSIEIYRQKQGGRGTLDDQFIQTIPNVQVTDGEVNLEIGNTYQWYGKIGFHKNEQKFYIKVKTIKGEYVTDGKDAVHARYLRIKNNVVSKKIEAPTNITPVKVGQVDKNIKRYELCKFDKISIKESNENTLIFQSGKTKLSNLVYETITPSSGKEITIEVGGFENKGCIQKGKKHTKEIRVEVDGKSISSPKLSIFSELSNPLYYIWPKYNAHNQKDSAKLYNVYIHSCRSFSNESEETFIVKAYPDIRWYLDFSLNLSNDLRIKWQNQLDSKDKELQSKAGKIGTEKRWKQKDASFKFSLKGEWDKYNNRYKKSAEFKTEYETKFKKLYDLFSSLGNISNGILSETKGTVRKTGLKGMPVVFAVKPPNLNLSGQWGLESIRMKDDLIEKIGTKVDISFSAEPLIGLEMTIDLLDITVGVVAGVLSGGSASKPAMELVQIIRGKMNTGVDIGNDKLGIKGNSDVYIDLIISGIIKTDIGFSFNTGNIRNSIQAKIESANVLGVELKAGMWVKGEISLVVVKVEGYFEMSGKGKASITFGNQVKVDKLGLLYRPQLGFDGIVAEYVIKNKVGLSSKKRTLGIDIENAPKHKELVPKFDVIEKLEEIFEMKAEVPLIRF
ncbi:hypothetical protein ACF3OE_03665 [Capnocytophaga canis]|uniref:hypothetical protein n=1 Tax=Capnocytophaga canis TaxID=1848903 RepID=UPI00370D4F70